MYTIIFTDGEEEIWLVHKFRVNAAADSINFGDRRFQFIRKFRGGGHFSGTEFEILRDGKKKCKLCDGYEYK